MDFAFPWPVSQGEWLAWGSAAVTVVLGLLFLFAPRLGFRLVGLPQPAESARALAASRASIAGFQLGLGLTALLLAQPLIYLSLGFAWAFALFGRIVSMMSDDGNGPRNWLWAVVEALLAALPLAFAFGFIP